MVALVFALVFYSTFVIYIMLAVYVFSLNKRALLNKLFALLSLSFSIWAITCCFSISALTYEEALFWRRMGVFGWGIIYSIVVHFALVLTGHKQILKKTWLYFLLYTPAVVNIYIHGPFSKIALNQYDLVSSEAGWINLPVSNLYNYSFYVYYSLYSLISLYLLVRWYIKTHNQEDKKNALFLLGAYGVTLIIGTLTDILGNHFLTFKLPQLAPIIILIIVITIVAIIKKYNFLIPQKNSEIKDESIILSDSKRVDLFKNLSFLFSLASVINIALAISHPENIKIEFLLSLVLVICATVIFLIPLYSDTRHYQEVFLICIMAVTMAVIMQMYYFNHMSHIGWPIPLLYIVLTIIYNNRKAFIVFSSLAIIINLVVWSKLNSTIVEVNSMVQALRFGFYFTAIALTIYIQKIYTERLKANEKQINFQKMIASISSEFADISQKNFDGKMNLLLEKSCIFTSADRSYLGIYSSEYDKVSFTHEWRNKEVSSIKSSEILIARSFEWSKLALMNNDIVLIPSIKALPKGAIAERKAMVSQGILSLIYIPIIREKKVIGFIGFDQMTSIKNWDFQDGDLLRVLANIIADGLKKIENEDKLNHLAYYDPLTDLPNRVLFENKLEIEIKKAVKVQKAIGVMLLDLDRFKDINDAFGHDWGDSLLMQVASRLTDHVKASDVVARFGGDEFSLMITEGPTVRELEKNANDLMNAFQESFLVKGHEFFISASIGIAMFPEDGEEAKALIENADMAMYQGKEKGKNQYKFCTREMKEQIDLNTKITNALYKAVDNEAFELFYQAQIDLKTGEMIGMEALIRWNEPEMGWIAPNIFIPIAEKTGLINDIGEWVLRTACLQNKQWQDLGLKAMTVAVNLSVEQFHSENIYESIKTCLEESNLEPQYLELEITESIAMKKSDGILEVLHKAKALGTSIAIDDFGTEYSSFNRLKVLPVNRLKIDIQFIRGIGVNPKNEAIIHVMIRLAKSLGLKVIAEGVETQAQRDFLIDADCDEIQGYYYYKPLNRQAFEENLKLISWEN